VQLTTTSVTVPMGLTNQVFSKATSVSHCNTNNLQGTSACPDGFFYCKNEHHLGAFIPSSRVNDGICGKVFCVYKMFQSQTWSLVDPECCDGSDEYSGRVKCPNKCADEHRKAQERREQMEKLMAKVVLCAIFKYNSLTLFYA
jgi:hypothetical protein